MKDPSTTLLITSLPSTIQNAMITDPFLYFEHLASLCGTVTRFKMPKPGVLFITMISVPECEKLKQMLQGLKRKPEFRKLQFKNVEQRTKPFQVIGLIGDETDPNASVPPLSDEYTKTDTKQKNDEEPEQDLNDPQSIDTSKPLTSIWQIINRKTIESFVRWKDDGIWFFVLAMEQDPKFELQMAQERLDALLADDKPRREKLKLLHLKTPLPVEGKDPEGFTGKYERIFIGHLTIGLEERCVRSHFSSFGPVRHVQIPKKQDGRTKGIAFVDYWDTTPVKLALLKNNLYFADNHIVVAEATEKRRSTWNDNGERFMQGVSVVEAAYGNHNNQNNNNYQEEEYNEEENWQQGEEEGEWNQQEGEGEGEEGWNNNQKYYEPEDEIDPTQVFICNVSYEAPPRKLKKLLKKAGNIEEFRPVMRDGEFTGKAFARYETEDEALAAMELHGTEFMGRPITVREVKISHAEQQRHKRKRNGGDGGYQSNKRHRGGY